MTWNRRFSCLMVTGLLVAAGCTSAPTAAEFRDGVVVIDRASDADGFRALFQMGNIKLTFDGAMKDGKIDVGVHNEAGKRISHIVALANAPGSFAEPVAAGALEVGAAVAEIAAEPAALSAYLNAYQRALQGIDAQLPFDAVAPKFRTAILIQLTIFIDASSPDHSDPTVLSFSQTVNAPTKRVDEYGSYLYPCQGCSPNDEDDHGGGSSCYPNPGGSCRGACGPGCGWCGANCCTSSACQWHDANCGSFSHFFSCICYTWGCGNNCGDFPQQIGCSG